MKTIHLNLHLLITLRGMREQAFKFGAAKFKGGMKGCYTKGCEIFTPLALCLKDVDLSPVLDSKHYKMMYP